MALSSVAVLLRAALLHHNPLLRYAVAWTFLLTATVLVISLSPEMAFAWALTPSSPFARSCRRGFVRVPMEGTVCVPARLFGPSKADAVVPPVFAALVVAGSACIVRAVGLWDLADRDEEIPYD
ncbi:hypothetical protein KSP39_PZI018453 [Platanthera zijinensis]|uniref:Uncharacterized protein n=1 Tax=Platanthera zijinensis TaxID=2320716 RepID=A0AAP0B3N9_9ASPA